MTLLPVSQQSLKSNGEINPRLQMQGYAAQMAAFIATQKNAKQTCDRYETILQDYDFG